MHTVTVPNEQSRIEVDGVVRITQHNNVPIVTLEPAYARIGYRLLFPLQSNVHEEIKKFENKTIRITGYQLVSEKQPTVFVIQYSHEH